MYLRAFKAFAEQPWLQWLQTWWSRVLGSMHRLSQTPEDGLHLDVPNDNVKYVCTCWLLCKVHALCSAIEAIAQGPPQDKGTGIIIALQASEKLRAQMKVQPARRRPMHHEIFGCEMMSRLAATRAVQKWST